MLQKPVPQSTSRLSCFGPGTRTAKSKAFSLLGNEVSEANLNVIIQNNLKLAAFHEKGPLQVKHFPGMELDFKLSVFFFLLIIQ